MDQHDRGGRETPKFSTPELVPSPRKEETSMNLLSRLPKLFLTAVVMTVANPGSAIAQTYPDKPVRIIIPYSPGSAIDVVSRLIGGKLSEWWGQPVVVESKPGASGQIAVEATKRSPA